MSNPRAFPCDASAIRAVPCEPTDATRKAWVLTAAVLGSTLAYVDESVVNVALPTIESHLGTSLAAMQWVINAYTLCMSAMLLVGGAAADQLGRRRIFLIGIAIFAAASIGCGVATNVATLIALRAIQGVGAAFLIPCSIALIGATFTDAERGAAIGIWSGAAAIASGAAPLLGGWLVDHWSWRAIFLINPLLAIITMWITWRQVPESRDPNASPGIDWLGAAFAFAGLGSLVYGLISSASLGWSNPLVLIALAAAPLLLVAFVVIEYRGRSPMMPLELFRSREFSGVNLLTLLLYGALGGAFFFLPFLLIQADGFSATAAGAAYLPFTIVLGLLSRWSGQLIARFGTRRPQIIGPAVVAVGFALLGGHGSYLRAVLTPMTVIGFGMVITVAPLTTAVINSVPPHRTGVASGINNAVAAVGGLLLVAILGSTALGSFSGALERHLLQAHATPRIEAAVRAARGGFVIPPMPTSFSSAERAAARAIVADSLADTVRTTLWIAAALALASSLSAAIMLPRDERRASSAQVID